MEIHHPKISSKQKHSGHTMVELTVILAISGILVFFSFSGLSHTIGSESLQKTAKKLERQLLTNQLLSTQGKSTIKLIFAQQDYKIKKGNGTKVEHATLASGITVTEASFGIYGRELHMFKSGTVSPGRVTISDLNGSFCSITIALRGSISSSCKLTGGESI